MVSDSVRTDATKRHDRGRDDTSQTASESRALYYLGTYKALLTGDTHAAIACPSDLIKYGAIEPGEFLVAYFERETEVFRYRHQPGTLSARPPDAGIHLGSYKVHEEGECNAVTIPLDAARYLDLFSGPREFALYWNADEECLVCRYDVDDPFAQPQ